MFNSTSSDLTSSSDSDEQVPACSASLFQTKTLESLGILYDVTETSMDEIFAKMTKTSKDKSEWIDGLFPKLFLTSDSTKQVLQVKMMKLLMALIKETLTLSLDNFNLDMYSGYSLRNDTLYKRKCAEVRDKIDSNIRNLEQDFRKTLGRDKRNQVQLILEKEGLDLDKEELDLFYRLVFLQ